MWDNKEEGRIRLVAPPFKSRLFLSSLAATEIGCTLYFRAAPSGVSSDKYS
jgi:hypothetical protein